MTDGSPASPPCLTCGARTTRGRDYLICESCGRFHPLEADSAALNLNSFSLWASTSFPQPLARLCHRVFAAPDPDAAQRRLDLGALFEATILYATAILVAQCRAAGMSDPMQQRLLMPMQGRSVSLGDWVQVIQRIYKEGSAFPEGGRLLHREDHQAFRKRPPARTAMDAFVREARLLLHPDDDPPGDDRRMDPGEFLSFFVHYRNETNGHGAVTREHCAHLNPLLAEAYCRFLDGFPFIGRLSLSYVARTRRMSSGREATVVPMTGLQPGRPRTVLIPSNRLRPDDDDLFAGPPDDPLALDLSPFLVLHHFRVFFLNKKKPPSYLCYETGHHHPSERLYENLGRLLATSGEATEPGPIVLEWEDDRGSHRVTVSSHTEVPFGASGGDGNDFIVRALPLDRPENLLRTSAISRRHGRLVRQDAGYLLTDESKNGTWVRKTLVHGASKTLRHGDLVVLGGTVGLRVALDAPASGLPQNTPPNLVLSLLENPDVDERFAVVPRAVRLGSDPRCGIRIDGPAVLAEHAQLNVSDADYHLVALPGARVLVDGRGVKDGDEVRLSAGCELDLGDLRIRVRGLE